MATADTPRRGFWQQVGRPFRALGRGIGRVLDVLDLLRLIIGIIRGVAWLFRSIGRAVSDWF
ncbi:hypothetical protein ACIGB8_21200 [Promicromonospora sukumoe]|uniref:hypothetical protein n=1 Tax=Promicromonospora sukumoe TaxID=88382 RepID=UPI0037CA9385